MLASELVKELQELIKEHGDLEVFATNDEGSELIDITEVYEENAITYNFVNNRFEKTIKISGNSIF